MGIGEVAYNQNQKLNFKEDILKRSNWTESEIELLKRGEIPPNRSKFSIKTMRQRLGLVAYKVPRWSKEHKNKLIELVKQGKNQKEISEILPYSIKGIQKQIITLKIQTTRQYKFRQKEIAKFQDFLQNNWQQKTPSELAEIWNQQNKKINKGKVEYHLRKLGIKIPREESLRLGYLKKKESKLKTNCKSTSESESKIRSLRIELMRKRVEQNKDLWTGLPGHNTFNWDDEE